MKKPWLLLCLLIIECGLLFGQDSLGKIYSIKFSGNNSHLSRAARATLQDVAAKLKAQPDCNFIIGYRTTCGNTKTNAVIWDRVMAAVAELTSRFDINTERLIIGYDSFPAGFDEIEFRVTTGKASTEPPPHSDLRKGN